MSDEKKIDPKYIAPKIRITQTGNDSWFAAIGRFVGNERAGESSVVMGGTAATPEGAVTGLVHAMYPIVELWDTHRETKGKQ